MLRVLFGLLPSFPIQPKVRTLKHSGPFRVDELLALTRVGHPCLPTTLSFPRTTSLIRMCVLKFKQNWNFVAEGFNRSRHLNLIEAAVDACVDRRRLCWTDFAMQKRSASSQNAKNKDRNVACTFTP